MTKRLEKRLERLQTKSDDVCVFLKLKKCDIRTAEDPYDCIDGGYMFCDKYTKLYQEYVGGRNG